MTVSVGAQGDWPCAGTPGYGRTGHTFFPASLTPTLCFSLWAEAIQSVLCGADALLPTKTGAVASAKLALHENGTLEYQVSRVHQSPSWGSQECLSL